MVVCGVCACVCSHFGGVVEFGEEEELVKCGERSVEAQLVRPPLQPAAASDEAVSSLPARPPVFSLCPTTPNPSPPSFPSVPAFCRLSPAVPSSLLSSPATMHPDLQRGEKKKNPFTHTHLQTSTLKVISGPESDPRGHA